MRIGRVSSTQVVPGRECLSAKLHPREFLDDVCREDARNMGAVESTLRSTWEYDPEWDSWIVTVTGRRVVWEDGDAIVDDRSALLIHEFEKLTGIKMTVVRGA